MLAYVVRRLLGTIPVMGVVALFVFSLLHLTPGDPAVLIAGELATELGTSAPTMSRHLKALLDAGVVADERLASDARARVFHLRPESMAAVQAWLDQLQAQWDEQLGAFKRHVEGGPR